MKKIFFALILCFWTVNSTQAASDLDRYKEECLNFIKKPTISLVSSYGRLRYNFDKDEDYLKRETSKKFKNIPDFSVDEFSPVGLTKVNDTFDYDFTVEIMGLSHGYRCVYPKKIKARLEYSMPTIYISKSLKKGSCLHELAVRHENTHMQIYIDALDYFLPLLKAYIDGQFDKIGVKIVAQDESDDEAAKELNNLYLSDVQKRIDAWRFQIETEQLKLDTPENYILENRICQEIDNSENEF